MRRFYPTALWLTCGLVLTSCLTRLADPDIAALNRPAGTGDPERGEALILNKTFTPLGLPLKLVRHLPRAMPASAETMERTPGVPGREGLNRVLPAQSVAQVQDGVVLIKPNCLSCHAGNLLGETVVGLGNTFMDTTEDLRKTPIFDEAWVDSIGLDAKEKAAWRAWTDAARPYMEYTVATSMGTSTAVTFTAWFFSHRDPETYAWRETAMGPMPDIPNLETDVPAWWLMKKKKGLYYGAEAVGDPTRHLMQFFSAPGNTMEDLTRNEADFRDIVAWLRSLEAPRWPWSVEAARAEQGKALFEQTCAQCHGTYGPGGEYPSRVVPLEKIGTDPERSLFSERVDGKDHYNRTWHAQAGGEMTDSAGYIAPPLDGVWATAPYLHNGSVPTLADLLSPEQERPAVFVRTRSSMDYDPEKMGWKVQAIHHPQSDEPDPVKRAQIYDTSLFSKSNKGHAFGTALSAGEKAALLEYLKTL